MVLQVGVDTDAAHQTRQGDGSARNPESDGEKRRQDGEGEERVESVPPRRHVELKRGLGRGLENGLKQAEPRSQGFCFFGYGGFSVPKVLGGED